MNSRPRLPLAALLLALGSLLVAPRSLAQGYPKVPHDLQAAMDAEKAAANRRSDEIFARALPEIQAWAAKGKPYLPGAAKPEDLPQAKIPAFPGAWGGGMYAFGGRGGQVIVVTNLNDDGPGSLRAACETPGPRFVVFNVAGIIRLKTHLRVRAPYITLDGSSAPGDGVCVAGNTFELETHDIILRHLRFRRGETDPADRDDSLGGNPTGNVIIDHVSTSWSLDENLSMYRHMYQPPADTVDLKSGASALEDEDLDTARASSLSKERKLPALRDAPRSTPLPKALKLPTVNITIQNCISSESLNTYHHAFGSTIGGLNSTFQHNLWACNSGRNPSVGMYGDFTFVNNVLFNWHHRTVDGGDHNSLFNIFNNYYKPGPGTPDDDVRYRLLKPESERNKNVVDHFGRAYVSGNVVESNERVTKDNWDGGVQPDVRQKKLADVLATIRVNEPFKHAPLEITDATTAYRYVLANAGATLPHRDPVDERILNSVRTGTVTQTVVAADSAAKARFYGYEDKWVKQLGDLVQVGFITNPSEVGGYPEYKGTPYVDSDGDGMPDDWETSHGLNPHDPSDAAKDLNGDGYTNIEKFLYGLDPRAPKTDWTDLRNNIDRRNAAVK